MRCHGASRSTEEIFRDDRDWSTFLGYLAEGAERSSNESALSGPRESPSWPLIRRTPKASTTVCIVIREGKITDVQLLKSSGLPLVDQEFGDFIRKRWVAAPGVNQNYPASMIAHRGYYPG
jgi:hypothetical protein